MKVNLKKIKKMDLVLIVLKMELNYVGIIRMVKKKENLISIILMEKLSQIYMINTKYRNLIFDFFKF